MKKQSLGLLLMLTACQSDNDSSQSVGVLDRIKTFFGLQKAEVQDDSTRPEGETRIIPPITSSINNGDWAGGAQYGAENLSEKESGPGNMATEFGYNTDSSGVHNDQTSESSKVDSQKQAESSDRGLHDSPHNDPLSLDRSGKDHSGLDHNQIQSFSALTPDESASVIAGQDLPAVESAPQIVYGPDMPPEENHAVESYQDQPQISQPNQN